MVISLMSSHRSKMFVYLTTERTFMHRFFHWKDMADRLELELNGNDF